MFAAALRTRVPPTMRNVSTHSGRGLSAVLQKNPDDVVITFAKRTAMGRNRKGQLKDVPVDEMMQALFKVDSIRVLLAIVTKALLGDL
jgi:acetyl-CoA acyltransferase 1